MPMVNAAVHLRRLMLLYLSGFLFFCDPVWAVESSVFDISSAVLGASAGEVINLPPGRFKLRKSLTITQENLVIKGAGARQTILDFSAVTEGGQGVLVRASRVTLDGFTILNAPGDGLVARGVENVAFIDIGVRWAGRRAGGYGIYPVQCRDVLVRNVVTSGATEAGIYVGQTTSAEISNSTAFNNVVGIDVENSSNILVQNNKVFENSAGISVTSRPYLFVKDSSRVRVRRNVIHANNLANIAPEGSFAKNFGSGRGVVLTAVKDVVLTENVFDGHDASDVLFLKFDTLNLPYRSDRFFDPELRGIVFEGNQFGLYKAVINAEYAAMSYSRPASIIAFAGYHYLEIKQRIVCFNEIGDTLEKLNRLSAPIFLFAAAYGCEQNS